jgi:hypothetical protein
MIVKMLEENGLRGIVINMKRGWKIALIVIGSILIVFLGLIILDRYYPIFYHTTTSDDQKCLSTVYCILPSTDVSCTSDDDCSSEGQIYFFNYNDYYQIFNVNSVLSLENINSYCYNSCSFGEGKVFIDGSLLQYYNYCNLSTNKCEYFVDKIRDNTRDKEKCIESGGKLGEPPCM